MNGPRQRQEPIDLSHGPVGLGRHVLLSTLGRGGMSVVYAAYDEALDRKVAIKVLRSSAPLKRLRLRREAQTLAQLTHPNVVRIYEICEYDSFDYIVMELVEGVTLGAWREQPREPSEVLAVYLAAGRGLAAAHAKGIVHRDFKPDNAMLRSDGQVLVMDFGLAREDRTDVEQDLDVGPDAPAELAASGTSTVDLASDVVDDASLMRTSTRIWSGNSRVGARGASLALTQVGAVLGTVGYMAPEQVRGRIADARSDQFSYCASVWEALYGERPFRGAGDLATYREELLAGRLRSSSRDDVPAWLRAVLERGLALEPGDRWPSMQALLDALVADPTRGRRRKLVSVAAVALLGASAAGLYAAKQHAHERELVACETERRSVETTWNPMVAAELEQVFLATEHPTAASGWAATRPWLAAYAEELGQLRRLNCVAERIEQTRSEAGAALVSACLDDGQASLAALVGVLRDADTGMMQHAAEAASTLPSLADCTDERRQASVLRPPAELREQLRELRGRLHRAQALRQIGQLEPALGEAEAILGEAEALDWAPAIAEALLIISRSHADLARWDLATAAAERAFRKAAIAGDSIAMIAAAVQLTSLHNDTAKLELAEAWRETAEALIRNARLESSLIAGELAVVEAGLASIRGDLDGAQAHVERGLSTLEARLGPEHPGLGAALMTLGKVLSARGELTQARAVNERQLQIYLRAYGPDSVRVITVYNSIGGSLQLHGEPAQATDYYLRGLAIAERSLGPGHQQVGTLLCNLGLLAYDSGDLEISRDRFERGLAVFEANLGAEHPQLIKPLVNLGTIASRDREHERALAYFRRALAILTATSAGEADERDVFVRASYADALARSGEFDEAYLEYERSLVAAERTHGPDHAQVIRPLIGLAEIDVERGSFDLADARIERIEALIPKQEWRQWELDFLLVQREWARGSRVEALAEIRALRARFVQDRGRYSISEIDVWLRRHGLSAEPQSAE